MIPKNHYTFFFILFSSMLYPLFIHAQVNTTQGFCPKTVIECIDERLKEAYLDKLAVKELRLQRLNLICLPSDLWEYKNIKFLHLGDNPNLNYESILEINKYFPNIELIYDHIIVLKRRVTKQHRKILKRGEKKRKKKIK